MRFILLNHDHKLPVVAYIARLLLIMLDDHSEKGNLLKIAGKIDKVHLQPGRYGKSGIFREFYRFAV